MNDATLLLMAEHNIEKILVIDTDTFVTRTIARDEIAQDADAAILAHAIITRHDPARLLLLAPVLVVSAQHVLKIIDELDAAK
jgi:hypothetical protein